MKSVSTMVQDRTGSLTHALEEAIGAHRIVKDLRRRESTKAAGSAHGGRTSCACRWRSRRRPSGARHADQPDHRLDRVGAILWAAVRQTWERALCDAATFITYLAALLHLHEPAEDSVNVQASPSAGSRRRRASSR
jgi:hypothetical protein